MGEWIGERLGAYLVTAHLADGALSAVYRAEHHETGDPVAVKVLRRTVVGDRMAVERFRREYETAKLLRSPYIVEVLDFGEAVGGAPFMVMELLEGRTLSALLAREGPMPPARLVRIVCQLALGLHCAHADGVVHRDLKPGNVFICETHGTESARILDFGSVKLQVSMGPKLTALGMTVGSPCYMSPEQAMGRPDVDPRSDLFSLAALVHEMATGEVAFAGSVVGEILAKIIEEEPSPVSDLSPQYPRSFDEVVARGLHKDKGRRFASAIELAEAALAALGLPTEVERWASELPHEIDRALARARRLNQPAPTPLRGLRRAAAGERGFGLRTTIPPK
jgi:serine/threonine-protein kinase